MLFFIFLLEQCDRGACLFVSSGSAAMPSSNSIVSWQNEELAILAIVFFFFNLSAATM